MPSPAPLTIWSDKSQCPLLQGSARNWIWERCPANRRENKIMCPAVAHPLVHPSGAKNPYQKPLPLYYELLERFTSNGDTVIELTGGSGTLLAACSIMYPDRTGAARLLQSTDL